MLIELTPLATREFTRVGHRKESAMATASALEARLDASYEAMRIRGGCGVTTEFLFERRALIVVAAETTAATMNSRLSKLRLVGADTPRLRARRSK